MEIKGTGDPAYIGKGCSGLNDKAALSDSRAVTKNMSLRLKSRESNALVYKRMASFDPDNRINQSGTGKLFLWHDESNRYGLCWDVGKELNAKSVRLMLEDSFTEYNVPLVIKTAHDNIFTIKKADDGDRARGIIVLANPVRYALFLGKIEWHLEEILEEIRGSEPVQREGRMSGAGENRPTHPNRSDLSVYYQDMLVGMIGLEQELVGNLRPQNEGENIRRQARRLAIDMTLLIEMVCDCLPVSRCPSGQTDATEVKNTDDAGIRRLAGRIQRWAM